MSVWGWAVYISDARVHTSLKMLLSCGGPTWESGLDSLWLEFFSSGDHERSCRLEVKRITVKQLQTAERRQAAVQMSRIIPVVFAEENWNRQEMDTV